jgi:SAM-dependent methyltransferase
VPAVAAFIDRPRARALIERGLKRKLAPADGPSTEAQTRTAVGDGKAPDGISDVPVAPEASGQATNRPHARARFTRQLELGGLAIERAPVTNALFERLSKEDVAEIERQIAESTELRELSRSFGEAESQPVNRHLVLSSGVYAGVPAALAKTGLSPAEPPEDIHAMSRGPLAAAGGLYEADFVIDALSSAGTDMATTASALDFGCSSARVVRVLAAAYPDIAWHGCDPNAPAIAWASETLPSIHFFVNEDAPPLPLADASLDLVYAISIWSHFEPALGLRWFDEMHRVIRPDGHLLCTTHGLTSIAFYATNRLRTPEQSSEIQDSLYRKGWWYAPEFGEQGDWGVVNPDWGTSFLSPEWLLTQLCPRWRVLAFGPGRNQGNQDVYVVQRA